MMTKEELRAARERLGLSRTQFGAYLGVSHACIEQWEQGRRGISMHPIALKVALAAATQAKEVGKPLPDWRQSAITPDMRVLVAGEPVAAREG